jgi:Ras family protein A
LWDTAGQEEYDRLRPLSYPETDLLFVCFAIDCPNSLENVMDKVLPPPHNHLDPYLTALQWYPEVLHFCPTTPLILVGLKSDLRTKRACIDLLKTQGLTPVTPAQGQAVAKRMGAQYIECSSKEAQGIDDVFELAVNTAVGQEFEIKKAQESAQRMSAVGGLGIGRKEKKTKKRQCPIL